MSLKFFTKEVRLLMRNGLVLSMCFISLNIFSQVIETKDSASINKKRMTTVVVSGGLLYSGSMIGLNQLWYADYDRSSFHFFNDNQEWMQMDKVGHTVTAYHFANAAKNSLLWAGLEPRKARNYGSAYGLLFQSTIELLDGFSTEWGASTGDIIANTAGVGVMWSQDVLWEEQRINFKFSYSKSKFAHLRPGTFGTNFQERFLKDYNGQTYWLSANISSFISGDNKFPKWLNVAGGYGIDGITGAHNNPEEFGYYDRNRQYYISLDVGLEKIKTNSKVLKFMLSTFSFVKIPAPTLEFIDGKSKFHWLYF